jgi:chromate transporter
VNPGAASDASAAGRGGAAPRVSPGSLLLTFLRLGLTGFGGPATVAYIREAAVGRKRWLTAEAFADGAALCQSIPGATSMQMAAYVGLRARGVAGAVAAFVGFGLPAFVLMVVLSALYDAGRGLPPAAAAFRGLNVIVVAIVANAAVNFGRATIRNWRDAALACGAAAFLILRGSPILAIAASAAAGALLYRGASDPLPPAGAAGPAAGRRVARLVLAAVLAGAAALAALWAANRPLFDLAAEMVKVDLFAFGGGFASVPVMLHQVVDVRHWMDHKTFMDGIALGQVTPGPVVITATFVGYQIAGLPGAVAGTVAVFSPSFLMLLITAPYLDRLRGSVLFRRALRGVLASFVGLLVAVTVHFAGAATWTSRSALVALAALAALALRVDFLWVVLAGAGVSMLLL